MGDTAGSPAQRQRGLAPLWRRAGVRIFQDKLRASLTFMVFVLIGGVAATEPLYLQFAGSDAVASLRQPPSAEQAAQAAVVRLAGGGDPQSARQRSYVEEIARIPHLGPLQVTAASIGYELNPVADFVPTASAGGVTRRVRLFGVPDPRTDLLITSSGAPSGVWLAPELGPARDAGDADTQDDADAVSHGAHRRLLRDGC